MRIHPASILVLGLWLPSAGCSLLIDADPDDLGAGSDAGAGLDAGPAGDAGPRPDVGPRPDAGRPDAAERCTPGATETAPCGDRCGTRTRSCRADGTWEDGRCEGEGRCVPGSIERRTCGTVEVDVVCSAACELEEPSCEVDVVLLFDVTGSHSNLIQMTAPRILDQLAFPLLDTRIVHVGVAYFADYPFNPYGNGGDVPFGGQLQPSPDGDEVLRAIESLPRMGGSDLPESGIEALHQLAGGDPHDTSRPFDCADDREGGGCYRPGARRVVVMFTDITQHGLPTADGSGPVAPYAEFVGAPEWDEVRERMLDEDIELFAVARRRRGSPDQNAVGQLRVAVRELGDDPDRRVIQYDEEIPDMAALLRELRSSMSEELGLGI